MCVNFRPPAPEMLDTVIGVIIDLHESGFWKTESWKDYQAPIVRRGAGGDREGLLASYNMVPRKRIPPGVRPFDTMATPRRRWQIAFKWPNFESTIEVDFFISMKKQ